MNSPYWEKKPWPPGTFHMSSPFLAAEAWQVLLISHFTPSTPEPSFLGPSSEGTAENWEDSEPV